MKFDNEYIDKNEYFFEIYREEKYSSDCITYDLKSPNRY